MKPIIITKEKNTEEITISPEEFERIVDEVYEQGKQDGKDITCCPAYQCPYCSYKDWTITTAPNVLWKDSTTCTSSSSPKA